MTAVAAVDLDAIVPGVTFPAPFHCLIPPAVSSTGAAAVELAGEAGLILDPWQAWTLDQLLRRTAAGKWAAPAAGIIVARQNGKGSVLEARELAGLFLPQLAERRLVHTAHRFIPTAKDAYTRITTLIDDTPSLRRRVKSMPSGKGDQAVILRSGAELLFLARAGAGAGRGLWGDVIILDEAYEIPEEIPEAMIPTMAARSIHGNPQLIYTSSPVNQSQHRHGRVLARVRRRALRGDAGVLWVEFAAGDRAELSDADLRALRHSRPALAQANPGLGVRISAEWVEQTERPSLSDRGYEVERLGIGDWPSDDAATWDVIAEAAWTARQGAGPRPGPPVRPDEPAPDVTLGVGGSYPDAEWMSIAACWRDGDDRVVELVDRRPGWSWVLPELERIAAELDDDDADRLLAVAIPKDGPAGDALVPLLGDSTLPIMLLDAAEQTQAAAGLKSDVDGDAPRLRHYAQPTLDDSLGTAAKHEIGDRWRFDRNATSDPAEAVAGARHANVVHWHPDHDVDGTVW